MPKVSLQFHTDVDVIATMLREGTLEGDLTDSIESVEFFELRDQRKNFRKVSGTTVHRENRTIIIKGKTTQGGYEFQVSINPMTGHVKFTAPHEMQQYWITLKVKMTNLNRRPVE